MRALLGFLKATLVGGIAFLLPLGVLLLVIGKLYAIAKPIGAAVHRTVFPGAAGDFLPFVFAVAVLLLIALAAGVFARGPAGRRVVGWFEAKLVGRLPPYAIARQLVRDIAGGADLISGAETPVVLVRLDDQAVLGFLVERRPDGAAVVFLPGAPSAFSGTVALVAAERIEPVALTTGDVVLGMRRFGAGLGTEAGVRP